MSRRRRVITAITISLLLLAVPVLGCGTKKQSDSGAGSISRNDVEKVELIDFHPRIRCVSCMNVEENARELVKQEFADKVKEGKLRFESLRSDDPANKAILEELDTGGSSLFLVITADGKRTHKAIPEAWLYWNKKEQCKEVIRNELSRYL